MTSKGYHEVEWTPETIRRFWDFYGANRAAEESYFSRKFGRRIIGLARRRTRIEGPVVDLGCGPGFLTEELLRHGYAVRAIDASPGSVERLASRLGDRPGFLGAAVGGVSGLPLEDGAAGSLFLIEVIEHLAPGDCDAALAEIARVVRPGGHLVATVPNREDLDAKKVACPECGCVFHRMQHLQSLDAGAAASLLDRAGFEPIFVRGLDFRHFPDHAFGALVRFAAGRLPALGGRGTPHLMAIGRRRAA